VQDQGGKLYVWAKKTRCCGGSVTFLETSSEPDELEVGGLRRKHVHAYWDGCAYVV
jgi:hypothetical protein